MQVPLRFLAMFEFSALVVLRLCKLVRVLLDGIGIHVRVLLCILVLLFFHYLCSTFEVHGHDVQGDELDAAFCLACPF